jgi:predicted RNase H-like nuclease (RuvC/YqgF family)
VIGLRHSSPFHERLFSMNARATQERAMIDEGRFGKLESDVQHLQADMTEVKGEVKSLRSAFDGLKSEFLSFKTEVAKEFGTVAKEFGSVRASVESLRTDIERAKLWMVVTGAGTILSVFGAAVALARFLKP